MYQVKMDTEYRSVQWSVDWRCSTFSLNSLGFRYRNEFCVSGVSSPPETTPIFECSQSRKPRGFATQSLYRIDLFPRYTRKKTTFVADYCTPKSVSLVSTRFVFFCFAPALYCIDLCTRYTRKKTTFEADNCTPESLSLVSTRFVLPYTA